jgi:hypothetical protein
MSEEIHHLYELLDTEQFMEILLEGLRRLLIALEEQVKLADYALVSDEASVLRPSNGRLLILGNDLITRADKAIEFSRQFHEVRSILAALALPPNYKGELEFHVPDAFYAIENTVQGFRFRETWTAEEKEKRAASGTASRQADDDSLSQTRSDAGSSDASEKPNTAPQDDYTPAPEPSLPPFVEFMVKLATELGITATEMKKEEVRDRIEERWDTDALGEPSAHKLEMMATLMRPPEAQRGRAKPKP